MSTLCACGCGKEMTHYGTLYKPGHKRNLEGSLCDYGHKRTKPMKNGKQGISWRCWECTRARRLSNKYDISFEDALEIPENCEICGAHEDDVPWGCMTLDHCHTTNRFRGWLCAHCNKGLGAFKDSIPNLKAAIKYLRRFNALQ